jgi:uncharacterized membrane protein YbhN (UPF0104 family)
MQSGGQRISETEAGPEVAVGADQAPGSARDQAEIDRRAAESARRLRNGLISLAVLVALVVGLLLAIPGLHGVGRVVTHMRVGWLVVAVVLEILSCLGYVLAFLQVFDRAPVRFGARVALSELAFGAAVSLGGAGSVVLGGWLLVERGGSVQRVAERSTVLFLLTSAINVFTFGLAGLLLATDLFSGPGNVLLGLLPAVVSAAALVFFLLLPRVIDRRMTRRLPHKVYVALCTLAAGIRGTEELLRRPDWRIIGAIGFLWCDIGVLMACFAAAGASPPLLAVVLAYQLAYMSNILPIPGNIGVLDGSMVGALVLYGLAATQSAAATIVYHAIALWIPAVWGTIAFVIVRRSRREPLILREPRPRRARG